MVHGLEVDVAAVRACASGIAGAGARVADGVGGRPAPAPGWATGIAAAAAADVAQQRLTAVAADITAAARQIIAAVVDYEAADDRAADRLRDAR